MPVIRLDTLPQFTAVNLLSDPGNPGGKVHVPQCAQVVLHFSLIDAKAAAIVLYGRYAGAFHGTQAEANAILTAITGGTAWTTLASFLATATGMAQVSIRDVNPTDGSGLPIFSSVGSPPGTSSGTALPSEVAAVITKRTAKAGRSGRGRMYFPGWATNALGSNDTIAAGAVTALGTWATNNVGSALAGSGYTHVLGLQHRQAYTSPKTGVSFPDRPATSVDITQLVVRDNHWDSQRRRGLK